MKKPPTESVDLDEFLNRFANESDRACAVLGAAYLDELLKDVFHNRLPKLPANFVDYPGPLSSFSSRIHLAHALSWVDDDVHADLDTIRGIRNDFAHSIDHDLAFENHSVKDRCVNLRTSQAFIDALSFGPNVGQVAVDAAKKNFSGPRWRYQITVEMLIQHLRGLSTDDEPFLDQVRKLAAGLQIKVQATGTFSPPPATE